jgi:hypothetical protein
MTSMSSSPAPGRSCARIDLRALACVLLISSLGRGALWGQVTKLAGHLETADSCQVAHIQLVVDLGGPCTTTDSGNFVCDAPGMPGDDVRLLLSNEPKCLIFYPPNGRTTIKRPEARESVTVTLVEKDSPKWKSTDELRRLLRASPIQRDTKALTPQQLDTRLREWGESVREQTGQDNEAFIKLMVKKQGQIQEFTRVTILFTKFLNRSKEILAVFRRYAPEAVGFPEAARQMVTTVNIYGEVFNEMSESGAVYQGIVETYWGKSSADEYRRLLDLALKIHREDIYPLNEVLSFINKLNHANVHDKKSLATAANTIRVQTGDTTRRLEAQLAELEAQTEPFIAKLREGLAVF